jgi:exodeoxyribonuclease VII large subunit
VAACTIPIISAVGHETDTTLCDFAADMRAPTPTAAAEMAVPVRADLIAGLHSLAARALKMVQRQTERNRERSRLISARLPTGDRLLGPQRQRADDLERRLRRGLAQALTAAGGDLARASGALRPALLRQQATRAHERLAAVRLDKRLVTRPLTAAQDALERLWRVALSLNPDRILERGYARIEKRGGGTITSAAAARTAGALTLRFADGAVEARVERAGARSYEPGDQGRLL